MDIDDNHSGDALPKIGGRFRLASDTAASTTSVPLGAVSGRAFPLRLAGLSILIVDDQAVNADSLRELLQLEGARAAVAVGGQQAIDAVRRQRFDVVVSDVAMPGVSGFDFVSRMREAGPNARTPAIAYSGYTGPDEESRARAAGFDRLIGKPATLEEFVAAIGSLCRRDGSA